MVVVAGGAARAGEHTCRKTKDSRDQEASGKAIKIFHGTVSKGQECERKRAAYPYCQPCEPVTGCTSEPHATQFAELHCRPTVQCGRCDGTHAVARNNSCVTYQITSAVPVKTLSRELGHERSPWASVHQAGPWLAYSATRSSRSQTRLRLSGRGDRRRHGWVSLQVTRGRQQAVRATALSSEWPSCQRPPALRTDRTAQHAVSPASIRSCPPRLARTERHRTPLQVESSKQEGS